jgi:hypothetical protein
MSIQKVIKDPFRKVKCLTKPYRRKLHYGLIFFAVIVFSAVTSTIFLLYSSTRHPNLQQNNHQMFNQNT